MRRFWVVLAFVMLAGLWALPAASAPVDHGRSGMAEGSPAAVAMIGEQAGALQEADTNLSRTDVSPQAVLILETTPVPEPATVVFLASSVLTLYGSRFRRR